MTKFTVSQANSSVASAIKVLRNIDIHAEDALVNDFSVLLQNAIDSLEALAFGMDRHIAYTEQQEAKKHTNRQALALVGAAAEMPAAEMPAATPTATAPAIPAYKTVSLTNRQALALIDHSAGGEIDRRTLSGNSFLGPFGTKVFFKQKGCSMRQWLSGYAHDGSDVALALRLFDRKDLTSEQRAYLANHSAPMTEGEALYVQDAYHYALAAAGGVVDGVETTFTDKDMNPQSKAEFKAMALSKASLAGYPLKAALDLPSKRNDVIPAVIPGSYQEAKKTRSMSAAALAVDILAYAKERGVDANTGERLNKLPSAASLA